MRKVTSSLFITACLVLPFQAQALDVSVGGVSASVGGNDRGGVSASASVGGSGGVNAGADIGGRSGGGLGADVSASVGGSRGINADVNASLGGRGGLNANANVSASAGSGVGVGVGIGLGAGRPGNPGGSVNPGTLPSGAVREAINSYNDMSRSEQMRLAKRCVDILGGGYDAALTQLCRMIRTASR